MQVAGWECRYYGMDHTELERRRQAVRQIMKEKKIAVLMANDMVREGYFQWFLGAGISERPTEEILIVPAEGAMTICLTSECFSDEQQRGYQKLDATNSQDARFGDAINAPALYYRYLADELKENKKVGILIPGSLRKTVKDYLEEKIPGLEWVDLTCEVNELKAVKSTAELEILQSVAEVHDRLFGAVGCMAIPGRTEGDLVKELRYRMYEMGCGGEDVTRNAVIHLTSAKDGETEKAEELLYPGRVIKEGDRINLKAQCVLYDDFYGVLGRCFVLGEASPQTKADWDALVSVQDYAASLLKPGATLAEVAAQVAAYRSSHGMPEDESNFLYGVGHTAGEAPHLTNQADMKLKEGMVLAVAPEYEREGCETMYCADLYRITETGAVRMNAFPRKVEEIFIQ